MHTKAPPASNGCHFLFAFRHQVLVVVFKISSSNKGVHGRPHAKAVCPIHGSALHCALCLSVRLQVCCAELTSQVSKSFATLSRLLLASA